MSSVTALVTCASELLLLLLLLLDWTALKHLHALRHRLHAEVCDVGSGRIQTKGRAASHSCL